MSYDYGPNSDFPQYSNEVEHRAAYWVGLSQTRPRSLFAGDPTVLEAIPPANPPIFSDEDDEPAARPAPSKKRPNARNARRVQQPAAQQALPPIREVLPDAFAPSQNPAIAICRPGPVPRVQEPIERPQHVPRVRNPAQQRRPLVPAPQDAPLDARIPGGLAAVRPRARPNGNALLDALDDMQPDPVYDIPVLIPIFEPTTGLPVYDTLMLKSDLAADEFRAKICAKMSLDPAAANLGFKTSRDGKSDDPHAFNTDAQVNGAILSITLLIPSARTKEVKLIIDNLTRRAQEVKVQEAKANSRKRGAAASTADTIANGSSIASTNRTQERLEAHLLCNSSKCKTPGVAGKSKYCHVRNDGTHKPVGAELRFLWADCIDKNPTKYTVYNLPDARPLDADRSMPNRARPKPAAAPAPVVHVHLPPEAPEPARKRRRVLATNNVIDLTADDDVKVVDLASSDGDVEIVTVGKVKKEDGQGKVKNEKEN